MDWFIEVSRNSPLFFFLRSYPLTRANTKLAVHLRCIKYCNLSILQCFRHFWFVYSSVFHFCSLNLESVVCARSTFQTLFCQWSLHFQSVAPKCVNIVREKNEKTCSIKNWVQTWYVLPWIIHCFEANHSMQSLEYVAVVDLRPVSRLDLCSLNKYSWQKFSDVKNNFCRQVCYFWARNMLESEEKYGGRYGHKTNNRWKNVHKLNKQHANLIKNKQT